jgi:hypothetical protein
MSSTIATSSRPFDTPVHVTFSATSNHFVTLYADGFLEVWEWTLPSPDATGRSRSEVSDPVILRTSQIDSTATAYSRQCACVKAGDEIFVGVLQSTPDGSKFVMLNAQSQITSVDIPGGAKRLVAGSAGFVLEINDGSIVEGTF